MKNRIKKKLEKRSEKKLLDKFIFDTNCVYDSLRLAISINTESCNKHNESIRNQLLPNTSGKENYRIVNNLMITTSEAAIKTSISLLLDLFIKYINDFVIIRYKNVGKIVVEQSIGYKNGISKIAKKHIVILFNAIYVNAIYTVSTSLRTIKNKELVHGCRRLENDFTEECINFLNKEKY